jgi:hypothetical protein
VGRRGLEEDEVTSPLKKGAETTHQGASKKVLFLGADGVELHKASAMKEGGKKDGLLIKNTGVVDVGAVKEVAARVHSDMQVDQKGDGTDLGNLEKEETSKGKWGKTLRYRKIGRDRVR